MASRFLPLFPLPLVLLPGAPVPLHIFEPRYRRLLDDCMEADRCFGLLFCPPELDEAALPRGHVGCVAEVDSAERLPDGRSNILVQGKERFALRAYVDSDRPYLVGEVEAYEDAVEPGIPLEEAAQRITQLFRRVGRAARALADDPSPVPTLPADPALLAFSVAAYIDLDARQRQELLASRSPAARLQEIETLLAPAAGGIEARAAVHTRARSNGHGPSLPA